MIRVVTVVVALAVSGHGVRAAELQPRTLAAYDRYVLAVTRTLESGPFLWLDGLAPARRGAELDLVRRGGLSIARLSALEGGRQIEIAGGLVHHWVGTVFVAGVTVDEAVALLQDYDRHERIYTPNVARSRLLERRGDEFRVFLRFAMKKVITVVVNSEHESRFRRRGADRAEAWIRSTRIAEVENPGETGERELPVGRDGGYLWRLNTYWRLLARDGGVYIQCESVSLTRGIPAGLGWLISPFVTSIPKESLAFTLETTRGRLTGTRGGP